MGFIFKAIEEASFTFHATLGFNMRVDLYRDMIKDRVIRFILLKKEKQGCQDQSDFH